MKNIKVSTVLVLAAVVTALSIGFVVIKKIFFNNTCQLQGTKAQGERNEKEIIQLKQELNQARKKVDDYKQELKKQQNDAQSQAVVPAVSQSKDVQKEANTEESQSTEDSVSQGDLRDKIEAIQEAAALSNALENCIKASDDGQELEQRSSNEKQNKTQRKSNDKEARFGSDVNGSSPADSIGVATPDERKKFAKKLNQVEKDVSKNLESNKKQLFDNQADEIKKAVIETVGGSFEEMTK